MSSPKDGIQRTFYPDGKPEGEVAYVDGKVNGITRHWHPNGVLEREIPVRNDIVEGVAKFWNTKGDLLGTYEIRDGTGGGTNLYLEVVHFQIAHEIELLDSLDTSRNLVCVQ